MGLRRRPRRRWVGALVHAGTGEGGFETRPDGTSGKWRRGWVPAFAGTTEVRRGRSLTGSGAYPTILKTPEHPIHGVPA